MNRLLQTATILTRTNEDARPESPYISLTKPRSTENLDPFLTCHELGWRLKAWVRV